ncbi:FmdB family zinc ribbon protein [Chloroflexota bacterium]
MPIYEYKCEDCSTQFELKHSFDDGFLVPCLKCKGKTRRLFSPIPIIFKGPGFYSTDSRRNGPTPEEN